MDAATRVEVGFAYCFGLYHRYTIDYTSITDTAQRAEYHMRAENEARNSRLNPSYLLPMWYKNKEYYGEMIWPRVASPQTRQLYINQVDFTLLSIHLVRARGHAVLWRPQPGHAWEDTQAPLIHPRRRRRWIE